MRMHNPPHPGRAIKEAIEALDLTMGQFAEHIGVSRITVSRIVNGRAGVTPEMSLRISEAFGQGTSAIWFRMQCDHDVWQAEHTKRQKVKAIRRPARLAAELKEMQQVESSKAACEAEEGQAAKLSSLRRAS